MEIIELVRNNNKAVFSHAIAGVLYYVVDTGEKKYQFQVDMNDKDDVGTTTFMPEYKAITLMRYIRKAMNKGELFEVK